MGRALWLAGGRDTGAGCMSVCDDSRAMITACAYLGSVNRRGRGRGSEEKENCGWEGGLWGDSPLFMFPLHPSWPCGPSSALPALLVSTAAEAAATWVPLTSIHREGFCCP